MKTLVIPDVHLKSWMFERATELMERNKVEKAVCLMDIPDDWDREYNFELYEDTFDKAIRFQEAHPNTLWCYGNHDLSYLWEQVESGFSPAAIPIVKEKLIALKQAVPEQEQIAYIHKIDNIIFLHGGLTDPFVKYYMANIYDDVDAVLATINTMGRTEMWDDASPIWYRPQYGRERMFKSDELLQVVGHTPVHKPLRSANLISCDTFSTYRNGKPIGTEEFLLIDSETWEWEGVK